MTDRGRKSSGTPSAEEFEADLDPDLQDKEREALRAVAVRLADERPTPAPQLRSTIRSRLLGDPERAPSHIGSLIFGYATSGVVLLLIAAAGLAGLGPFAT
jgi:hypothetical protein